tara:strand:+ start:4372 stop:5829 length:1458 start_codon:yes stop_codon:yes gene_type:complete
MSAELFLWVLVGVSVGITAGAIPGLTGAMAITLTLPLTFSMEPAPALALLVAMYVGSVSGGLITATLFKMPGTPASMMTTLDAFPMAAAGKPRRALALGIGASLIGGLLSWVVLVALARPIAGMAVKMHPFDYFGLVLLAFVLIAAISKGDLIRGLLSVFLGMLFALPGANPANPQPRLTWGFSELDDGFRLLPVLIGLFAVSEAILLVSKSKDGEQRITGSGGILPQFREWKAQWVNLIRSSMIGSFVGVLPGIGANIGSLLAYGAAKSVAKDREVFGKGADSAVVASESANNATVGGALVPLIALGIPGSVIDAILLGAFVLHGITPGPLLFDDNPEIVQTITGSYLVANLVMFVAMWFGVGLVRKLGDIPKAILIPAILTFCVVGSFALANRMFDVWVMLAFGILGLVMTKFRIPIAPFVLGFVLQPLAEVNLVQGLAISGPLELIARPSSGALVILSLVFLGVSIWRQATSARSGANQRRS